MNNWQKTKIGDILINRKETPDESMVSSGEIPIISKIGFNDGNIEIRLDGVSNTQLISVYPNDLVISGINVEKGAIGINHFDKRIASTIHYSAYHPLSNDVDIKYLWYFFRSNQFKYFLKQSFPTGIKTEVKPIKFLSIEIPLPSYQEQLQIISSIEGLESKILQIKKLRAEQEREIGQLLYSKYLEVIKGAKWLPMSEVAPIKRRKVEIDPEKIYHEIGVRSFGRGLFEKASFKGIDLSWQQPYWMKEGDLLFSNIKAWEGAVGLIPKQYDGWVGSHRYITCLPNLELIEPEFLYYYFKLQEGIEQLFLASPGSADRNKTLNTKKLEKILIPVPDKSLQNEFLGLLKKIEEIKNQHNNTLFELNDLLPSLLNITFPKNF